MLMQSRLLPAVWVGLARIATISSVFLRRNKLIAALALLLAAPAPAAPPAPTTLAQSADFIGTAINVVDLARELRFYTEVFGLQVAATLPLGTRSETILRFPGNPAQASLLLMHDTGPAAPRSIEHGNGFSRLVIRVVDIAATAAKLTQLGYRHGELREGGQGYRIMMLNDPEGFRLEVVQKITPRNGN
jgi:catechol 2,3-dioxygenase-like lactoylglutathione lyase family enzyme